MRAFLVVLAFSAAYAATLFDALPLFERFQKEYGRVYATEADREYRFKIFAENLVRIEERNRMETNGAIHGVTRFADLTPEEFQSQFLKFIPALRDTLPTADPQPLAQSCPADQCDWHTYGATTAVKDQGSCGSCWAFSAAQAIETAAFFYNGTLPILAPQQIVDCDKKDGGCNGGDTPTAYQYVINAGGLELEQSYPYTARDGTCKFDAKKVAASISSYQWGITPCNSIQTISCNNQNETGLWNVVQNTGPQSICVNASPWQFYLKGIFDGTCAHGYLDLNHCVHLTGYGSENGNKYWLVKNSWGTGWGEKGFIRLAFGKNQCGVADEVTYAVGKKV